MERLSSPTPTTGPITSRSTSVVVPSPKKDGGCKLCPDRDGGGGNGVAPSPAEAWDGGAVCTPSSANGNSGALDMLGNRRPGRRKADGGVATLIDINASEPSSKWEGEGAAHAAAQ